MDILISIVITIVVGVLLTEGYAWQPRFAKWLVELAVSQLIPSERDRYREEWNAHLQDIPNSVVKVVHALSFAWPLTTRQINGAIVDAALAEIDSAFVDVRATQLQVTKKLSALTQQFMERQGPANNIEHRVQKLSASLRCIFETEAGQIPTRPAILELLTSYEEFGTLIGRGVSRASAITAGRLGKWNDWIAQVTRQLESLDARRSNLRKQVSKRRSLTTNLPHALQELDREVKDLRRILENPCVDDCDEATKAECERIVKALNVACRQRTLDDLHRNSKG